MEPTKIITLIVFLVLVGSLTLLIRYYNRRWKKGNYVPVYKNWDAKTFIFKVLVMFGILSMRPLFTQLFLGKALDFGEIFDSWNLVSSAVFVVFYILWFKIKRREGKKTKLNWVNNFKK